MEVRQYNLLQQILQQSMQRGVEENLERINDVTQNETRQEMEEWKMLTLLVVMVMRMEKRMI